MLSYKNILITGGGSGIGEALTMQLSKKNSVIICGRGEDKLRRVAAKRENVSYYVADLSTAKGVDLLFNHIRASGIKLDVIINNAGVVERWDIMKDKLSSDEIFAKIDTNLSGAIAATHAFVHQADQERENLIINISSEIAFFPIPVLPLYSTSKTGLHVFTQVLRAQLKHTSFKVVEILPPAVDTDMPRQLGNRGKLLNADSFALQIIQAVEKGKFEYAPGSFVPLLKLFSKFMPATGLKLVDKMSRNVLKGNVLSPNQEIKGP